MKKGVVVFGGAGPGAEDLVTLRLHNAIKEADIIVFAGSLVNPEILKHHKDSCNVYDSASMDLGEITDVMVKGAEANKKVLRVHTGDPSMYGAIAEQIKYLEQANVEYEVIPGVSSVFAAAAAVSKELTLPGITQTMILTRRAGRTPVPPKERLELLGAHGSSMGLFLSISDMDGLVKDLNFAGYGMTTPIAVVYRASWPDQKIVTGILSNITKKVKDANITRQAIVLIGDALAGKGEESLLYASHFSHGYRDAKKIANTEKTSKDLKVDSRFYGKTAIHAITEDGVKLASTISDSLNGQIFAPVKLATKDVKNINTYQSGEFDKTLSTQWSKFDAHIFIMSAGIVVRKISTLLKDKVLDPAVTVVDERALHAISLLSGHIGGANELTQTVADVAGALPVITTATDIWKKPAFDSVASKLGWIPVNKEAIKKLNSLFLQNKKIALVIPEEIYNKNYKDFSNLVLFKEIDKIPNDIDGIVAMEYNVAEKDISKITVPILMFRCSKLVAGIGCKAGVSLFEIEIALKESLVEIGYNFQDIEAIATVDIKKDEDGLNQLSKKLNVPINHYSSNDLDKVDVPSPSKTVAKKIGTSSVCEASAIKASSSGRLILKKRKFEQVTIALAI